MKEADVKSWDEFEKQHRALEDERLQKECPSKFLYRMLAMKIEAKLREDAISRLVLGEVKPITLENALERYS